MITQVRGWLYAHSTNFISGAILSIFSYFSPVRGVLIVAFAAILLDLITGIIAARIRGEGIKSKKLYKTGIKIGCVSAIILMTFAIDKEIPLIELHKIVAWLIVGFELWSILENMAQITDHPIFKFLQRFMKDKIEKASEIDLEKEEQR